MAAERWCSFAIAGNSLWLHHRIEIEFGAWRLRLIPATATSAALLEIDIAAAHIDAAAARRICELFLRLIGAREGNGFTLAPSHANRARRASSSRARRGS